MKIFFSSILFLMLLGGIGNINAQTADGAIYSTGTTITVKFKPSGTFTTAGFTGGNFGIRWLTSLGADVNLVGETGTFGYVNQGPKAVSGAYSYIIYASASSVALTTYTAGVEYVLMSVTVAGLLGTGTFELCPPGFAADAGQWYIEIGGADRANPILANWYYTPTAMAESPLPVELTSFTASTASKKVTLSWKTATEKSNYGFDIERRIAGTGSTVASWTKLGFVEGAGTTNTPQSYTYTDNAWAGKFEYRLKQIDRDGKFEYSKTVEATVAFTAEDFGIAQNYPNPFNPATTIRFAVKSAQHAVVKVFNSLGQEVRTLFNETAQPETMYSLAFDASGLPSGSYYYMLRTADRTDVRRMLLVK